MAIRKTKKRKTKKRKIKRQKNKRRRTRTRKRKTRRTRRKRGGYTSNNKPKNFKYLLLKNIEQKEGELKPMFNNLINKYFKKLINNKKLRENVNYDTIKNIIENTKNQVLENVEKEIKRLLSSKSMKGGSGGLGPVGIAGSTIGLGSICFLFMFWWYTFINLMITFIFRMPAEQLLADFYIATQGGEQAIIQRLQWEARENDERIPPQVGMRREIKQVVDKIYRIILIVGLLYCTYEGYTATMQGEAEFEEFRRNADAIRATPGLSPEETERRILEAHDNMPMMRQLRRLEEENGGVDNIFSLNDLFRGWGELINSFNIFDGYTSVDDLTEGLQNMMNEIHGDGQETKESKF